MVIEGQAKYSMEISVVRRTDLLYAPVKKTEMLSAYTQN